MERLKKQKIWVCWKYADKNGRRTKQPYATSGRAIGTNEDYRQDWKTYEEVRKAQGFDGIGFVMPKGCFLLDVDHRDADDPLFQQIKAMFPTYVETSPSGHGFHFYGMVDLDRVPKVMDGDRLKLDRRYYTKNSNIGLELYIGGLTNRFATFTGKGDGDVVDCTDSVLTFLDKYMRRQIETQGASPVDDEKFITLTEEDIPGIVEGLRLQKNSAKFVALYDKGDISEYGSSSEADAALCAMIAFRTGPNAELIDEVFRSSALYRDKWDRDDYSSSTINSAIRACKGVFHHSLMVRPDFVVSDGKKDYVHPTLLAEHVRNNLQYIFVQEAMRGAYRKYVYSDGCYRYYSDDMFKGAIKKFVTDYNPMLLKMGTIDETFRQLCTDLNYIPQTALNADEKLINFQNGLLDINTLSMRAHSPALYTTIQIPCEWTGVPSPTPVFDGYLSTLTSDDEATQLLLLEFIGACISNVPGYRMKKALFLYGPGDSGKSQIKRLTEKLLGDGNFTGIDLQQMEARFGTSSIYGKRLSGSSDMSFMTVSELKTFKKVTGGDVLFAEFKGQDSFEFVYGGMLWFCMNELPKFGGDDGTWVFERILPVSCPNVIPVEERDSEILDKMYEERSGIVYKAIMAFRDVIARGYRFTETQGLKDARADYRIENNTAVEFFKTCMKPRTRPFKNNDPITVSKVYRAYCRWYDQCYGQKYRKSKKEF